jgi:hypothetical protein
LTATKHSTTSLENKISIRLVSYYQTLKRSSYKTKIIGVSFFIFCSLLALAAYWPVFPGDQNRLLASGDPIQSVWFLDWMYYAIRHGINPFFSDKINVPLGVNLAQNTLMPFLGLIIFPITAWLGPIASFNLLIWLAFPLSATAMYYAARKLGISYLGASLSGICYGFSPYVIGQAGGHLMLSFIPLPPLILLATWRLCIAQTSKAYRSGVLLAIEIIMQFFISPEVLAITLVAIAIGLVIVAIQQRSSITKARLLYIIKGGVLCLAISSLLLAYPLWFMLSGPQHFNGPNFSPSNPYRSDLFSIVVPSASEHFIPSQSKEFSVKVTGGDASEAGSYVGIVLLLIMLVAIYIWRANKWLLASLCTAVICWTLSLGPFLVSNLQKVGPTMPFALFTHLPLLQDIIPARLSLGEWLFLSLAIGITADAWQSYYRRLQKVHRTKKILIGSLSVGIVVMIIITQWPQWPYRTRPISSITAFNGHRLKVNTLVLTYPLPLPINDTAMLWQARQNMQFRLVASYMQNPNTWGKESEYPPLLSPPSVESWLSTEELSQNSPWNTYGQPSTSDLRAFVRQNHITAVVIDTTAINAKQVSDVFTRAFGQGQASDNLIIWTEVSF